ncbi:MAG: sigma-70 family RNA polymerase sigma factor [Bdellovibrionales bacterium]|nr:sigma-70 family RNA polymerase sigma factor [Bdellovibrionales bacterium]
MERAQKGDRGAYSELLTSLTPVIRGFVRKRIADESSVDDICQDVLLSIHLARRTYLPSKPFKPWLFTITRRRVIDHQRRRFKRRGRELLDDGAILDLEHAPNQIASMADFIKATEKLPEKKREAIRLVHIEGKSTREAAELLGMNETGLRVMLHRTIKGIKEQL